MDGWAHDLEHVHGIEHISTHVSHILHKVEQKKKKISMGKQTNEKWNKKSENAVFVCENENFHKWFKKRLACGEDLEILVNII